MALKGLLSAHWTCCLLKQSFAYVHLSIASESWSTARELVPSRFAVVTLPITTEIDVGLNEVLDLFFC